MFGLKSDVLFALVLVTIFAKPLNIDEPEQQLELQDASIYMTLLNYVREFVCANPDARLQERADHSIEEIIVLRMVKRVLCRTLLDMHISNNMLELKLHF